MGFWERLQSSCQSMRRYKAMQRIAKGLSLYMDNEPWPKADDGIAHIAHGLKLLAEHEKYRIDTEGVM